jgi:hypothetical protein
MGAKSATLAKPETKQPARQSQRAPATPKASLPQREFAAPGGSAVPHPPARSLAGIPPLAPGEISPPPFASPSLRLPLQRKLAIGAVNDPLESEADAMAEQVMRAAGLPAMPPSGGDGPSTIRRKCACGGSCDKCKDEKKGKLQRKAAGALTPTEAPPIVHEVLRSPGQPLDSATRSFFEPRFGADFSNVRIHTGQRADRAARDVSAAAFTVGSDIAFARGRYAPETTSGKQLLAHELTHTIQQGHAADQSSPLQVGRYDDQAEVEAGPATDSVMVGPPRPPTRLSRSDLTVRRSLGDKPKARTTGLTAAEWEKIKETRRYFNLPARPTTGQPTIVGVLRDDKTGKEYPLRSGEEGGPFGGSQRGNVPRGKGEAFTQGGQHQGNIATHVEGHAAAVMHEQNITEGTLLIEEQPCEGACDATRGWDPVEGNWSPGTIRPATPNISTALPPGTRLTVVDPDAAGVYRSSQIPSPFASRPTETTDLGPSQGSKNPPSINTPPPEEKVPKGIGGGLPAEGELTPKLPKATGGTLVPESGEVAAAEGEAAVSSRVLAGLGNIAFDIVLLVTAVVWELVVEPKIRRVQQQLDQLLFELEASRRKRMEAQIKERFDIYQAKHIGRIVKSCWLGKLRELEKAGRKAFVNVNINVSFEDTSGRIQLFNETPPESLFDLEFYDIELIGVTVSDEAQKESVGKLVRCESCGAGGRDKSFIGNNPLWQQRVAFSFEAPKSTEISKEFEKEPDVGKCIADLTCFIATACYGSPHGEDLDALRAFRDAVLSRSRAGRCLIRLYYRRSTPAALWLWSHPRARIHVRKCVITPLARLVRHVIKEFDNQGVGT